MKEQNVFHPSFTIGLWSQAVALIMGIGLHTSAILAGRSVFLGTIFTPALDLLFVPFITLGGILGIRGYVPWRAQSGWLRVAGAGVSVYFLISIPFHAKTILTWSTAHFAMFPEYYSLIIIPIQLLFLWIVLQLIQKERATQRMASTQAS